MAYGIRYKVTTHWGTFLLDEGAYRDYLKGKLWITWQPAEKAEPSPKIGIEAAPVSVSKAALKLRDKAAQTGLTELMREYFPARELKFPYKERMSGISIQELNLSVRCLNGLMCAGAINYGRLMELLQTERGLYSVRNLGAKSVKEISESFAADCYSRLSPAEQAVYWQDIIDNS